MRSFLHVAMIPQHPRRKTHIDTLRLPSLPKRLKDWIGLQRGDTVRHPSALHASCPFETIVAYVQN